MTKFSCWLRYWFDQITNLTDIEAGIKNGIFVDATYINRYKDINNDPVNCITMKVN